MALKRNYTILMVCFFSPLSSSLTIILSNDFIFFLERESICENLPTHVHLVRLEE